MLPSQKECSLLSSHTIQCCIRHLFPGLHVTHFQSHGRVFPWLTILCPDTISRPDMRTSDLCQIHRTMQWGRNKMQTCILRRSQPRGSHTCPRDSCQEAQSPLIVLNSGFSSVLSYRYPNCCLSFSFQHKMVTVWSEKIFEMLEHVQ